MHIGKKIRTIHTNEWSIRVSKVSICLRVIADFCVKNNRLDATDCHKMLLLRRIWLQMNLYCADSGSKWISTAQNLAPNESLLRRIWLQMNLYCADSGSKWISTAHNLAPNESLLRRIWLQINLYCADSGSKWISTASTAQTLAPNESLLCRLWLQMNLYCADSGSKLIFTAQTLAPNESLLRRLWLQTNLYCADSGYKRISTVQTSFTQDGSGRTEMYSLHFSIVEGSGDASSIFFYCLCYMQTLSWHSVPKKLTKIKQK